jgi:phosphoenolpyruvate carboxykinase (GTP)
MAELLTVHDDEWRAEVPSIREHYAQFNGQLPAKLAAMVDDLEARLA